MHPYGGAPYGCPLVCTECKERRYAEFRWKLRNLKFGVCKACRKWAIENLEVGEDNCTCQPGGNYLNGVNNNEKKAMHLCQTHENWLWEDVRILADREINWRRRAVRQNRQPAKKRRDHGWSRKKQHANARRRTREPDERRHDTRLQPDQPPYHAVPRCYCGEKMDIDDHAVTGPNAPLVEALRVRHCVGCNEFVRNW